MNNECRQLVIAYDSQWEAITAWLRSRGWITVQGPSGEDDLPTYYLQPAPEAVKWLDSQDGGK